MHNFPRLLTALCAIVLLAIGCSKPTSEPPPAKGTISLIPANGTITSADVDSVEVYLTATGQPAQRHTMSLLNGYWQFKLPQLAAGTYHTEIRVYQRKASPTSKESFVYMVWDNLQLPLQSDLMVALPTGSLTDQHWRKRLMMHNSDIKTTFITGLQFTDPFLELRVGQGKEWEYVYVDRIALWKEGNTSRQVGAAAYESFDMLRSPGILNNTQAFAPLALQMTNQAWNHGEILLLLVDPSGADHTYFYSYNK